MSVSRIPIRLVIDGIGNAEGEIVRIRSPRTADTILRNLPIEGMAALWQQEVYFDIPVKMGTEKASPTVEKGDLAYWPMGSAFCIYWGETHHAYTDAPAAVIFDHALRFFLFRYLYAKVEYISYKKATQEIS